MDEYILRTIYLNKVINKKNILNNINLDIKKGEIFGFLGPNGAGKTTTIKTILGLTSISSGDIYIYNHSIRRNFKKAMMDIGCVFEEPHLYDYLTGLENLKFSASLFKGLEKSRIEDVAKLCEIDFMLNEKVSTYSLSMKIRLSIAIAILGHPKLLVLDEPTTGLDKESVQKINSVFKNLVREEGLTIFISSHLLPETADLCDRVAIIDKGKIVAIKSSEELKALPSTNNIATITINTDCNSDALSLLLGLGYSANETSAGIEIGIDHDKISELISVIINAKINVIEVIQNQAVNLENSYLSVLGGEAV